MLRKLFILFFFFTTLGFGQKKIGQFINSLKTSSSNIKDVIPIVNTKNGDFAIFIADAKNVYAYKLDENFTVKEKMASEEKRRKFKTIIGSSISEDNENYRVYLTDKQKRNFISFNFSFQDEKTSSKEFKLNGGDKFIQTVSSKNKLYIIATSFISKGIFIYTFDDAGNPKRKSIDLSGIKLVNWNDKVLPITSFLTSSENVKKIEESNPNSIEIAASDTKMYVRDHTIVFTFDDSDYFTQVLNIDLNNYAATSHSFDKPMQGAKKINTNSYLNGDKFFTLASNKNKLIMEVLDYKTGTIIKDYTILKDNPITFKNTPIIQEGGIYNRYRELEKTKKFLRKINSGKIGLSVLKRKNNYEITLGGYVMQTRGGGGFAFGGVGGFAVGVGATMFYNPAMVAYGSYSSSKSTRIECLFDENFNHIKGEIEKNAFDKMEDPDSLFFNNAETVFKYKGYYLKGSYDSTSKIYSLRKYTN
jgi:hypothetical protein